MSKKNLQREKLDSIKIRKKPKSSRMVFGIFGTRHGVDLSDAYGQIYSALSGLEGLLLTSGPPLHMGLFTPGHVVGLVLTKPFWYNIGPVQFKVWSLIFSRFATVRTGLIF